VSRSPTTCLSCDTLIDPGRSIAPCPQACHDGDSSPSLQSPPSRITRTASPNSSRTCSARVGLTWAIAVGGRSSNAAAKGRQKCCAIGAPVCVPRRYPGRRSPVTHVVGSQAHQGQRSRQNASASFSASTGTSRAQRVRKRTLSRCTITGSRSAALEFEHAPQRPPEWPACTPRP